MNQKIDFLSKNQQIVLEIIEKAVALDMVQLSFLHATNAFLLSIL